MDGDKQREVVKQLLALIVAIWRKLNVRAYTRLDSTGNSFTRAAKAIKMALLCSIC